MMSSNGDQYHYIGPMKDDDKIVVIPPSVDDKVVPADDKVIQTPDRPTIGAAESPKKRNVARQAEARAISGYLRPFR